MSNDHPDPAVPHERLSSAGFSVVNHRTETLFEMASVRIHGVTVRYEDERSRDALAEATGGNLDHPVRFFAVTRLGFQPSLPPGLPISMFASTIRSEVRSSFEAQLDERGLVDVNRSGSNRERLGDRTRVRVREFTATDPLPDFERGSLALEFRVAVVIESGTVQVVTGGFPAESLSAQFDLDAPDNSLSRTPEEYESEFFELLKGVSEALNTEE